MNRLTVIVGMIALIVVTGCSEKNPLTRRIDVRPRLGNGSSRPLIRVYFSPRGGCTEAIIEEISRAQRTVRVQAYSFTSAPIAAALRDAHRRGVDVEVLLDKSNETSRYSAATFTANAGIPTYIDDNHAIAHSKIMIIDGSTLITGSFNFTKSAEQRNAENVLIIKNAPDIVRQYEKNYEEHRAHGHVYERFATRSR